MKIADEIYGEEKIKEPILIELVNCDALQRLKGISQYGIPNEYYYLKDGFSRYDHSLGVLILLRRLSASLNEQVAGVLHDVSHTAFSHVVDWLIGDPTKEDYQDSNHWNFIIKSEIPEILRRYGLSHKSVSNLENFSLLEREAPSLCADRIDYSLREIEDSELVKKIVSDLSTLNGQIVFQDIEIAEIFAEEYSRMQKEHWAGEQARARYYILANILRRAIDNKIVSFDDLNQTDDYVLNLLIKSNNEDILYGFNLLRNGFRIEETDSDDGIVLKKKFRYIDPEILLNGNVVKLSEISQDYRKTLERLKQESKLENKILILEKLK